MGVCRPELLRVWGGAPGGYALAGRPTLIFVGKSMTAWEPQTLEINAKSHPVNADRCSTSSSCSIRPVWQALQQRIDDLLDSISVEDLLKQESQVQELVTLQSAL